MLSWSKCWCSCMLLDAASLTRVFISIASLAMLGWCVDPVAVINGHLLSSCRTLIRFMEGTLSIMFIGVALCCPFAHSRHRNDCLVFGRPITKIVTVHAFHKNDTIQLFFAMHITPEELAWENWSIILGSGTCSRFKDYMLIFHDFPSFSYIVLHPKSTLTKVENVVTFCAGPQPEGYTSNYGSFHELRALLGASHWSGRVQMFKRIQNVASLPSTGPLVSADVNVFSALPHQAVSKWIKAGVASFLALLLGWKIVTDSDSRALMSPFWSG